MNTRFNTWLTRTALVATVFTASATGATPQWQRGADLPVPRTEVAAARNGSDIVVVGGYLIGGATTNQVDGYSPAANAWRRLPNLPLSVNHAMAATWRGRIVVAGGYTGERSATNRAFVLERSGWRELPSMPAPRAAGGAAVLGDTLYIVGGVSPPNGLARTMFALDLRGRTWRRLRGPTPREHLAVTAWSGRLYALAGRTAGLNTNVRTFQRWAPGARRWTTLRPVPRATGGTGAAAVRGRIVSVGGEAPTGTVASVYAYNTRTRRWSRASDLPRPRHGLGVVAFNGRVYAIGGGPQPGLTVSGANEFLTLP